MRAHGRAVSLQIPKTHYTFEETGRQAQMLDLNFDGVAQVPANTIGLPKSTTLPPSLEHYVLDNTD